MYNCLQSITSATCADGTGTALGHGNLSAVLTVTAAQENGMARNRSADRLLSRESFYRSRTRHDGLRKTQTFERERIMTADEIRETNYGEVAYLREIAAQIAELNENIKLMQQSHTVLRETDDNDIGF